MLYPSIHKKVYLIHGDDVCRKNYFLSDLRHRLIPNGVEAFNEHSAARKKGTVAWIRQMVDFLPLQSQHTIVSITDLNLAELSTSEKNELCDIINSLPEYCYLVFIYDRVRYELDGRTYMAKTIKTNGYIIEFPAQKTSEALL